MEIHEGGYIAWCQSCERMKPLVVSFRPTKLLRVRVRVRFRMFAIHVPVDWRDNTRTLLQKWFNFHDNEFRMIDDHRRPVDLTNNFHFDDGSLFHIEWSRTIPHILWLFTDEEMFSREFALDATIATLVHPCRYGRSFQRDLPVFSDEDDLLRALPRIGAIRFVFCHSG